MKNGDRRVCEDTFIPEIYVAGRWCNLESLVDVSRSSTTDFDGLLKQLFDDRWKEAKDYLEST